MDALGSRISKRAKEITFTFEGEEVSAVEGQSLGLHLSARGTCLIGKAAWGKPMVIIAAWARVSSAWSASTATPVCAPA
ncbi:hypothetical protein HORIV_62290 [Vreelandella olivaria]|uniref:Uncharacterized protein n=1 Tax=Vreelandella olivaria TaxID=390919 RepID=A0ABM7GSK8_9GAMM|nr:hypothetical protein HORIV_62290 [Halomonas olivaria]